MGAIYLVAKYYGKDAGGNWNLTGMEGVNPVNPQQTIGPLSEESLKDIRRGFKENGWTVRSSKDENERLSRISSTSPDGMQRIVHDIYYAEGMYDQMIFITIDNKTKRFFKEFLGCNGKGDYETYVEVVRKYAYMFADQRELHSCLGFRGTLPIGYATSIKKVIDEEFGSRSQYCEAYTKITVNAGDEEIGAFGGYEAISDLFECKSSECGGGWCQNEFAKSELGLILVLLDEEGNRIWVEDM